MEAFYKDVFLKGAPDAGTPAADRRFEAYYATRTEATKRSYGAGWKRFTGFLTRRKLSFHDMEESHAIDLLGELNKGGATAAQIQSTAAAVSFAAEAGRTENPFASPIARKIKAHISTEATIAGRTKEKARRPMDRRDFKALQSWFWARDSSPLDREVAVLACLTYLGQRRLVGLASVPCSGLTVACRLADLRELCWRDIDISKTEVRLCIKRHKTSRHEGGRPLLVSVDGAGEADMARMLRAWRQQICDEAGGGSENYLAPRIVGGIFAKLPAASRTLQRAHAQLAERLGLRPGMSLVPVGPSDDSEAQV